MIGEVAYEWTGSLPEPARFKAEAGLAKAADRVTSQVGALQAKLRGDHLKTHLQQTALLNAQQVQQYNVLRGSVKDGAQAGDSHPSTGYRH